MAALRVVTRILVLGTLALSSACATPLRMPEPVRAVGTLEETRVVIIEGMSRRGWIIDDEKPGRVLASIFIRGHTAKVWITYDDSYIRFTYGGSDRLKCLPAGDSCSFIDSHYNKWVRNLAIDINRVASAHRAVHGPGT
jgi:hypothetical protein